jgi:hypothetical protein
LQLHRQSSLITRTVILTTGVAVAAVIWLAFTSTQPSATTIITPSAQAIYPDGIANPSEPSGMSPPAANALPGYALDYVTDFPGSQLPAGWQGFVGTPGGGTRKAPLELSHLVVSNGLLQLNVWKDPKYQNQWVAAGLCQCDKPFTYGAFFVRSKVTGPGPNEVELLWPIANEWPPEIDFNETGPVDTGTSVTVHFTPQDYTDQRTLRIDMTKWHTWGIIWSPTSLIFTVDGITWAKISALDEIPHQPMTLHIQQQTWCSYGRDCPKKPVSFQINWVAEYERLPTTP